MIAIAKIIFCFTIRNVRLEMEIASLILERSSSMMTMSAASIAASLPSPPIAIPISACTSTGASFIPSPTKASVLFSSFFINFSTRSNLSCGNKEA